MQRRAIGGGEAWRSRERCYPADLDVVMIRGPVVREPIKGTSARPLEDLRRIEQSKWGGSAPPTDVTDHCTVEPIFAKETHCPADGSRFIARPAGRLGVSNAGEGEKT